MKWYFKSILKIKKGKTLNNERLIEYSGSEDLDISLHCIIRTGNMPIDQNLGKSAFQNLGKSNFQKSQLEFLDNEKFKKKIVSDQDLNKRDGQDSHLMSKVKYLEDQLRQTQMSTAPKLDKGEIQRIFDENQRMR